MTGVLPSGRMKIEHYVGSLKRRLELKNSVSYKKTFVFTEYTQILIGNMDNHEKVQRNIYKKALYYLKSGLKSGKSIIFPKFQNPKLCKLQF